MRSPSHRHVAAFYGLAVGISWLVWTPWVLSVQHLVSRQASPYWHLAGSLGPAIAATCLFAWSGRGGRPGPRALFRQLLTARALGVTVLWSLLVPTVLFVGVALGLAGANHHVLRWERIALVAEYPALGRSAYFAASLFFYGFGEELGWRGFLYPALRIRLRPLAASLLVVPFWALWHAPLFFATESYRAMGVGGAVGWLASLASGSLLTAWLYDRANGSVLPAAVLHAVLDIFFLADIGVATQSVLGAGVTVAGLAVVVDRLRDQRAQGRAQGANNPSAAPEREPSPATPASPGSPRATFAR